MECWESPAQQRLWPLWPGKNQKSILDKKMCMLKKELTCRIISPVIPLYFHSTAQFAITLEAQEANITCQSVNLQQKKKGTNFKIEESIKKKTNIQG